MLQVYAKEEELCELQVKLGERDSALKAYKTENSRFADMKDKFKADIGALQQQVPPNHVKPHMYCIIPQCSSFGMWHAWFVGMILQQANPTHSLQLMLCFSVHCECTPFAGPSFSKSEILCTSLMHLAMLQVSEKEEEKATLLTMCNELMNKLEREGISL